MATAEGIPARLQAKETEVLRMQRLASAVEQRSQAAENRVQLSDQVLQQLSMPPTPSDRQ